jgi:hypothetical protein
MNRPGNPGAVENTAWTGGLVLALAASGAASRDRDAARMLRADFAGLVKRFLSATDRGGGAATTGHVSRPA